jgi:hypothetical protein
MPMMSHPSSCSSTPCTRLGALTPPLGDLMVARAMHTICSFQLAAFQLLILSLLLR